MIPIAPLWAILRPFLPSIGIALVAFGAGWSAAWHVQGLRLQSAQQDLIGCSLKIDQIVFDAKKEVQDAKEKADIVTKEVNDAIPKYVASLHDYYRRNPVIRLLPPAVGDGQTGALPAPACGVGPRPPDDVPSTEADLLTPGEQRRALSALESCGETTLLFVQCRDWAKRQRAESLKGQ